MVMTTLNSRTITVSIERSPQEVYSYVSNPANFPEFATSFVRAARQEKGEWVLDTTAGPMTVRFVPRNDLGVLDHTVKLPTGAEVYNAMRVIPNGRGSEVVFTLFQMPEVSATQFSEDAKCVQRDLQTLKAVLEKRAL
jgi:hypothetical protein